MEKDMVGGSSEGFVSEWDAKLCSDNPRTNRVPCLVLNSIFCSWVRMHAEIVAILYSVR